MTDYNRRMNKISKNTTTERALLRLSAFQTHYIMRILKWWEESESGSFNIELVNCI